VPSKKSKPDKFFMGKPSQNYMYDVRGISEVFYGFTQSYLHSDIREHTS